MPWVHTNAASTPLLQLDNETGLLTWTSPSVVPHGVVGFRVLNMNGYNAVDIEVPSMVRLPPCVHCVAAVAPSTCRHPDTPTNPTPPSPQLPQAASTAYSTVLTPPADDALYAELFGMQYFVVLLAGDGSVGAAGALDTAATWVAASTLQPMYYVHNATTPASYYTMPDFVIKPYYTYSNMFGYWAAKTTDMYMDNNFNYQRLGLVYHPTLAPTGISNASMISRFRTGCTSAVPRGCQRPR